MIKSIALSWLNAATFPALSSWFSLGSSPITTSCIDKEEDIKCYWILVSSVDDDPIYMLMSSASELTNQKTTSAH
jgi:hypothetical protein